MPVTQPEPTVVAKPIRRGGGMGACLGVSARRRPGRWAVSITATLVLSLTLLTAGAGGAAAQDSSTLVSNTGQTSGTDKWSDRDHSQAFTTGPEERGYKITSVAFEIVIQTPGNTTEPTFEVAIFAADSSGRPTGASLATFERSGALTAGVNTFSVAGGSSLTLDASTQYVLVFDFSVRGDRDVRIQWTASDAEDANAASGWSIADNGLSRAFGTANAFSQIGGEADSMKVTITGYAVPDPRPPNVIAASSLPTLSELGNDYAQVGQTAPGGCGGTPMPGLSSDKLFAGFYYYCHVSSGTWVLGRWVRPCDPDHVYYQELIARPGNQCGEESG